MFTHLHWHSTFSFLEAIWKPEAIVQKAKSLWMESIAITDFNWIYWAIEFYSKAKQNNIKPIIWVELWFSMDINSNIATDQIRNINLLAKDYEWYVNLMKIISFANKEWLKWKPQIDISTLQEFSKGIIAFFGGELSRIWKDILDNLDTNQIIEKINKIKSILWEKNVLLELIAQDESKNDLLSKINHKILEISESWKTDIIVNNIFYYPEQKDKESWEYALAIKDWKKIYDQNRRKSTWEFHIMSEDEIISILQNNSYTDSQIQSRIKNNSKIANQINIEIALNQMLFPKYQVPDHIKNLYKANKTNLICE